MRKLFIIAMAAVFSAGMVSAGYAQAPATEKKAEEKAEKKAEKKMEKAEKKADEKATTATDKK